LAAMLGTRHLPSRSILCMGFRSTSLTRLPAFLSTSRTGGRGPSAHPCAPAAAATAKRRTWAFCKSAAKSRLGFDSRPRRDGLVMRTAYDLLRWRSGGLQYPHEYRLHPFTPSPTFAFNSSFRPDSGSGFVVFFIFRRGSHLANMPVHELLSMRHTVVFQHLHVRSIRRQSGMLIFQGRV
jgi:hypothetical protein